MKREAGKFDDAMTLVMYKIYNWLGIRGAPTWVLDLFIPLLCYNTTPADVVLDKYRKNRSY